MTGIITMVGVDELVFLMDGDRGGLGYDHDDWTTRGGLWVEDMN